MVQVLKSDILSWFERVRLVATDYKFSSIEFHGSECVCMFKEGVFSGHILPSFTHFYVVDIFMDDTCTPFLRFTFYDVEIDV